MPTFLSDPSAATYAIMAVMVFVTGVMAAKSRKKKQVIPFALGAAALLALFLIDHFTESPREAVAHKIAAMNAAGQKKDYASLLTNVSDTFTAAGLNKARLKELGERANAFGVEGVSLWDATRANYREIDATTAEQGFLVQAVGSRVDSQRYAVGTFKKEADGEWRLTAVKLYNPLQRTNGPEETVPGL